MVLWGNGYWDRAFGVYSYLVLWGESGYEGHWVMRYGLWDRLVKRKEVGRIGIMWILDFRVRYKYI